MQKVQASEAKTQFLRILDKVERGENVIVMRRGKTVARIIPEPSQDEQASVDEAMQKIREIRKRTKPVSLEEILSARNEGRR